MTWQDVGAWLLWLCGPGILIWRRVSYAACLGFGRVLLMQAGQPDADEKEAFARGRTELMSRAASSIMALQPADVLARLGMLWAGLVFWRNQARETRLKWWSGLCAGLHHDLVLIGGWFRDPHRAWNYWRDERVQRRQMKRDVQDMHTLANVTADPLHPQLEEHALVKVETLKGWEMQRQSIARRILDPNQRTQDGDHLMHEHLGQQLARAYMDDPVAAKVIAQGMASNGAQQMTAPRLFAPAALLGGGMLPWAAGGVALLLGIIGVDHMRIGNLKHDNEALKRDLKASKTELKSVADNRAAWISAYDKERAAAQLAREGVAISAKTIEAERARVRAAASRKRRLDDAAQTVLGGGTGPDWISLLDGGEAAGNAASTPTSGDDNSAGRVSP